MTFDQLIHYWPFLVWASAIVFFTGGAWFTLWGLRRDFQEIKPLIEKVPLLEVRVDKTEEEIRRLRDWRVSQAEQTHP